MVIKLVFTTQREIFNIEVVGREIFYSDRIWKNKIRIVPKDEGFERKLIMSRNRLPNVNLDSFRILFTMTKEEEEEYTNAKTEKELADICVRDVRKKGGVLRKRDEIQ